MHLAHEDDHGVAVAYGVVPVRNFDGVGDAFVVPVDRPEEHHDDRDQGHRDPRTDRELRDDHHDQDDAVATAPTALKTWRYFQPFCCSRRWWTTMPVWESVKQVNTPTA